MPEETEHVMKNNFCGLNFHVELLTHKISKN